MTAVNVVDADGTVNVTAGSDVDATVVVVYTKLGKIAVCCEHLEIQRMYKHIVLNILKDA